MSDRVWLIIIFALILTIIGTFTGHFWSVYFGYMVGAAHMLTLDFLYYLDLHRKVDEAKMQ